VVCCCARSQLHAPQLRPGMMLAVRCWALERPAGTAASG
jgi:hypothetical protein